MLWIFWHLLLSGSFFPQNLANVWKDETTVKYPTEPPHSNHQQSHPAHTDTHVHTDTLPCSPQSFNQRGSSINGSCSRGSSVQCGKITAWCRQTQPKMLPYIPPPSSQKKKSMHPLLRQVASSSRLLHHLPLFFCPTSSHNEKKDTTYYTLIITTNSLQVRLPHFKNMSTPTFANWISLSLCCIDWKSETAVIYTQSIICISRIEDHSVKLVQLWRKLFFESTIDWLFTAIY